MTLKKTDETTEIKLHKLYKFIGYKIQKDLAIISITCSSYGNQNNIINQDALAIVGDHVIKLIITSITYQENNSITREEISRVYQKEETNENLERIGIQNNIDDFLMWNNTDLNGEKKRATTIEAIIGAVYLSNGIQAATEFVGKIGLIKSCQKSIFDIIPPELFEKKLSEMNEYSYQSLVYCVVDAIFSISANYTSTKKTVERFANYIGLCIYDSYSVSQFIAYFESMNPEVLATTVFHNRQRTSTRNGILKAEAVQSFLTVLHQFGIESKSDLIKNKYNDKLKTAIKKIKGQSSLITFNYVLMLSGDIETFKRDRHIINFFQEYLKVSNTSEELLRFEFNKQLELVRKRYPDFNARTLDGVIWQFMSKNN